MKASSAGSKRNCAELAFVQGRMRALVVTVKSDIKAVRNFLRGADIEVMRALRSNRRVQFHRRLVRRADKLRDCALIDVLQRWWCKVARVTGMQGGPGRRRVNHIKARAKLVLVGKCVDHIETAAKVNSKLL